MAAPKSLPLEAIERLKELETLWDATGQEKWALGGSGYLVTVEDKPAPVADLLANPDPDDWKAAPTLNMAMARGRFAVAAITVMPALSSLLSSYEAQAERLRVVEEENTALREALEPTGETKAAYSGEFKFQVTQWRESEDQEAEEEWEEYLADFTVRTRRRAPDFGLC